MLILYNANFQFYKGTVCVTVELPASDGRLCYQRPPLKLMLFYSESNYFGLNVKRSHEVFECVHNIFNINYIKLNNASILIAFHLINKKLVSMPRF